MPRVMRDSGSGCLSSLGKGRCKLRNRSQQLPERNGHRRASGGNGARAAFRCQRPRCIPVPQPARCQDRLCTIHYPFTRATFGWGRGGFGYLPQEVLTSHTLFINTLKNGTRLKQMAEPGSEKEAKTHGPIILNSVQFMNKRSALFP